MGLGNRAQTVESRWTRKFETNVPGIFAVGDINTGPRQKKIDFVWLHEAALRSVLPYIFPEKEKSVCSTPRLPEVAQNLGVETPVFD